MRFRREEGENRWEVNENSIKPCRYYRYKDKKKF
jgi:hypothetical protein